MPVVVDQPRSCPASPVPFNCTAALLAEFNAMSAAQWRDLVSREGWKINAVPNEPKCLDNYCRMLAAAPQAPGAPRMASEQRRQRAPVAFNMGRQVPQSAADPLQCLSPLSSDDEDGCPPNARTNPARLPVNRRLDFSVC